MSFSELALGASGAYYMSSLTLAMLSLILAMSLRLFWSRRKKAYLTLTLSVGLMMIGHALEFVSPSAPASLDYLPAAVKMVAFLVVNMALYRLYNPTRRLERVIYGLMMVVTLAILGIHMFLRISHGGASPLQVHLIDILIDLYPFGVLFACFLFVAPSIGQTHKYQSGLLIYAIGQGAHLINKYVAGGLSPFFGFLDRSAPLLYLFLLFLFVFDRVVELMQAVYTSSITDGLTGLYNRSYFYRQVVRYVNYGFKPSIVFFDIDNFKKLNDTLGHQKGDETLKKVAAIVSEEAETIGIAGRYGGEEIVLLVTDTSVTAQETAERIRERVEAEAGVTVSVGYSKHRKGMAAETLVKQADEAMYVSKTTGKNKVTGYTSKKSVMLPM